MAKRVAKNQKKIITNTFKPVIDDIESYKKPYPGLLLQIPGRFSQEKA